MDVNFTGSTGGSVGTATLSDQRRPEETEVGPELISLLRGKVVTAHEPAPMDLEQEDPLAAARGVITGILLSLIAWLIIGIVLWFLL